MTTLRSQSEICKHYSSPVVPPIEDDKAGIALATLSALPLNALRHYAENGTCGWYIWGGEYCDDPEFFQPLHVHHLPKYVPELVPYLALSPGWRVLLAPGHADVWYDPSLLSV